MDDRSLQTTDVVSACGTQEEAVAHGPNLIRSGATAAGSSESLRSDKQRNGERNRKGETSSHAFFKHEGENRKWTALQINTGARRGSVGDIEDVVCTTGLRDEREPQNSLTHTHTHSLPPSGFIIVWSGLVEAYSRSVTTPPHPQSSLPLVWAAVASSPLFSQQLSPQGPTPATHKHAFCHSPRTVENVDSL